MGVGGPAMRSLSGRVTGVLGDDPVSLVSEIAKLWALQEPSGPLDSAAPGKPGRVQRSEPRPALGPPSRLAGP